MVRSLAARASKAGALIASRAQYVRVLGVRSPGRKADICSSSP